MLIDCSLRLLSSFSFRRMNSASSFSYFRMSFLKDWLELRSWLHSSISFVFWLRIVLMLSYRISL